MAAQSGTQEPTPIRWPLSSFPGASTQESAGRLYNCYAETLDDGPVKSGPSGAVWRRSAGLSQQNNVATGQSGGYRGGLIVGNLSYEVFPNSALTVDVSGNIALPGGTVSGTKKVSIARNQRTTGGLSTPDIVICDPDNGPSANTGGGGAFAAYSIGAGLGQANSVAFQDGYFFFGLFNSQVFASNLNSLTVNALSNITL
jgi:hypothetical protein